MYFDDIFTNLILPIIFAIIIGIVLVDLDSKHTEELEIIKNTKEYQVYEKCHLLDDKYYCYNLEK